MYARNTVIIGMDGVLIAFRLARYDKNRASELVKRLYGQATSSHGGRYRYRRRGLLDDLPHRRLIRCVLILRAEDADRVAGWLRELGAEVHVRRGGLTEEGRQESWVTDGMEPKRAIPRLRITESRRCGASGTPNSAGKLGNWGSWESRTPA